MSRRSLPFLVALMAGLALPGSVFAQDFAFNAQHVRYDATGTGLSVVAGPDVLPAWRGGAGITLHVADKPFALYSKASGTRELSAIVQQSAMVLEIHGGFGFGGIADLGLVLPIAPVVVWGQGADGIPVPSTGDGPAVGDLVLVPKVQILNPKKTKYVGLGVQIPVSLPTGQKARYMGDGGVGLALDVLAELRIWKFRVLANISPIHVRPKVEYGDIVRQLGMDWGAGLSFQMLEMLALRGEIWGTVSYLGTDSRTTGEWSVSVAMTPGELVQLELGVGSGLGGFTTPGIRAFAGARFTIPGKQDDVPSEPVVVPPAASDAPAASDTPAASDAPAASDTPAASDAPAASDTDEADEPTDSE